MPGNHNLLPSRGKRTRGINRKPTPCIHKSSLTNHYRCSALPFAIHTNPSVQESDSPPPNRFFLVTLKEAPRTCLVITFVVMLRSSSPSRGKSYAVRIFTFSTLQASVESRACNSSPHSGTYQLRDTLLRTRISKIRISPARMETQLLCIKHPVAPSACRNNKSSSPCTSSNHWALRHTHRSSAQLYRPHSIFSAPL